MTIVTPKVTIAYLTYNYWDIEHNTLDSKKELTEGYSMLQIPGEGAEVEANMKLAIMNKATQCGLFNLQTITPKEYENAMQFKDKKNGK